MVKVSESAIKIVSGAKRKWLRRLNQKVLEAGETSDFCVSMAHVLPVDSRHLTRRTSWSGTWKPRIVTGLRLGQHAARYAHSDAGLGGQKKRMSPCNGADTGLNVTRHESEPTSDWSFIAKESGEPSQ